MALAVDQDTIFDFTTKLVELGGIYQVQEDLSIKNTVSNEIVAIPNGKRSIPLKLFKDGMESGDYALLMPYKEPLGVNREREWFFDSLQIIIGNLVKELMRKIIQDAVNKKDDNYQQYALMNLITGQADATMLNELDKLRAHDLVYINYNKKSKTAVAQTRLNDPDLVEEHSKFRKKTWEVFKALFQEFIGTLDMDESYTYQSTILNIPETDAKLHVIVAIVKAIGPFAKDILNIELHENVLEQHLANLEGYAKLHAWVSATSPGKEEISSKPWETTPMFGATPMPVSSMGGFGSGFMPASQLGNNFVQQPVAPINPFGCQPLVPTSAPVGTFGAIPASSVPSYKDENPFGSGFAGIFGR